MQDNHYPFFLIVGIILCISVWYLLSRRGRQMRSLAHKLGLEYHGTKLSYSAPSISPGQFYLMSGQYSGHAVEISDFKMTSSIVATVIRIDGKMLNLARPLNLRASTSQIESVLDQYIHGDQNIRDQLLKEYATQKQFNKINKASFWQLVITLAALLAVVIWLLHRMEII